MDNPGDDIRARLLAHQAAFDALIELIPPKHYLAVDPDEQAESGKFAKNKRKRVPNKSELVKQAKRAKLDPEFKPSVLEIQEKKAAEAASARHDGPFTSGPSAALTGAGAVNGSKPATIADLHARLQQKISELRSKRGIREESPAQRAKSKEEILEKRAKEKAAKKKATNKGASGGGSSAGGLVKSKDEKKSAKDGKPASTASKPDGEDFNFGKLEDPSAQALSRPKKKKDVNALLKKAEKREQLLAEKEKTNPEEARAERERLAWKKAEQKALGAKATDDAQLLRKTIKRQKAEKKKSAKEWADRLDAESKSKSEKQESRNTNLQARKESKKGKGERGKKGTEKREKERAREEKAAKAKLPKQKAPSGDKPTGKGDRKA